MGRRSKYLTAEERALARNAQARKYRASDRGKATKAEANRRSYQARKHATADPESILALLDTELPAELHTRGRKLFRAAFAAYDSVPTLGLWTPPYQYDPPSREEMDKFANTGDAEESDDGTSEDLGALLWCSDTAILGSLQCERIMDTGEARAKRWQSQEPINILHAELRTQLSARIESWSELNGSQGGGEWEEMCRNVALDWGAKIIVLLVEEWEIRVREGVDGYRQACRERHLPWQEMLHSLRLLLKEEN